MRRYNPQLPTDQLAEFRTSVHGRRLAAGDTQVANCVSCHGVHGILPASDARSPVHATNVPTTCARCHGDPAHMAAYGIPTDQFVKYQRSVHGQLLLVQRDVSAPACNDCHGNHGAFPPGADSVAMVCGQCHPINKELFLASPHKTAFQRLGLPECVACHGNHEVVRADRRHARHGTDGGLHRLPCPGQHGLRGRGAHAGVGRRAAPGDRGGGGRARQGDDRRHGDERGGVRPPERRARRSSRRATRCTRSTSAALEKVARPGRRRRRRVSSATRAPRSSSSRNRRWLATIPLGMIAVVGVLLYAKIRSLDREPPPPGS